MLIICKFNKLNVWQFEFTTENFFGKTIYYCPFYFSCTYMTNVVAIHNNISLQKNDIEVIIDSNYIIYKGQLKQFWFAIINY